MDGDRPCYLRSETVKLEWRPRADAEPIPVEARRVGAREWNRLKPLVHEWEDFWAPIARLLEQAESEDPAAELPPEALAVYRRQLPDDLLARTQAALDAMLLRFDDEATEPGFADAALAPEHAGSLFVAVHTATSRLTDFERGKSVPPSP